MPGPTTAVLMPTTRPALSARAPPEFPGCSAASVWITLSTTRLTDPDRVGSERPSALTTPAVTDPANPSGFPMATTSWPTRRLAASPRVAGTSVAPGARTTARSERGSMPTTSMPCSDPSTNEALPRSLPVTTWAEVRMNPSGVMTTPEPPPSASPPRHARRVTRRLATDGDSAAATLVTTRE
jgi:hypothetical protein